MISLKIEKQCGCFRKSSLEAEQNFNTKEEALNEAKKMCEDMNTTFCQKHIFNIVEQEDDVLIKMQVNH